MVPVKLSLCNVPSNERSFPFSHCGGNEKLIFSFEKLIGDMGLALPPDPTNSPTRVASPDNRTSSHDGTALPDIFIVMSHLPITEGSLSVRENLSPLLP